MIDFKLIENKIKEMSENNGYLFEDDDIKLFYEHIEYYENNKNNEKFDKELIDVIYDILINATYENMLDYPYIVDYLINNSDHFPYYVLEEVAISCKYSSDPKKYDDIRYKLVNAIASMNFDYYGLTGGFALVNMLFSVDNARLETAKYLIKNKDYTTAFHYLVSYRRDEICQKWYHERTDYDNKEIINLLKKTVKGMEKLSTRSSNDTLYKYLAYAYYYGIGTNIDLNKARYYVNHIDEFGIDDDFIEDIYDDKRMITTLSTNSKINDIVELGLYDYRAITWKILDRKDDKFLLLANECLESNYMVNEQLRIGRKGSFYKYDDKYKNYDQLLWVKEVFKNDIKKTFKNASLVKCFLLNKEEIKKSLQTNTNRKAKARYQAIINGYDNTGVVVNEEGYASYLVGSNRLNEDVDIVNEDGKFDKAKSYHAYLGIRPAIWVKIKQ